MIDAKSEVVVGVDGSEPSLRAAEWAAVDAVTTGLRLVVCYVSDASVITGVPLRRADLRAARAYGDRVVDRALVRIEHAAAPVDASGEVVEGNPAAELIGRAAAAEQVVLGSASSGGLARIVFGSVAAEVAAHAPCPAVVVRGGQVDRYEVVVGVNAPDRSHRALEYAFHHAARHGGRVHAVHAADDRGAPLPLSRVSARAPVVPDQDLTARELLAEAVAPWALKYPAVEVEITVVDASAAWTLVQMSRDAALVVVGSRGRGRFTGLLLGSVSQALLRHADCPVAVVR